MNTTVTPGPILSPRAQAEHKARAEREAAALRENLRRRKQQARAREAAGSAATPPAPFAADPLLR